VNEKREWLKILFIIAGMTFILYVFLVSFSLESRHFKRTQTIGDDTEYKWERNNSKNY
jgi:hypothetical protein